MKKIFKYFLIYIYNKMLVLEKYLKNNNVVFQTHKHRYREFNILV